MKQLLFGIFALFLSLPLQAQVSDHQISNKPYEDFGDYRVYYSVFNSAFVRPETAKALGLSRADDRIYINISVSKKGSLGVPANIEGVAVNLMQQKKQLNFKKISEPGATYYLAEYQHLDQEMIHFSVQVQPDGEKQIHTLKFSKKLHKD